MKTKFIPFFLPLLLLFSCYKDDSNPNDIMPKDDLTQLPPETQEGKNTFGCLVNGQVWRNQGGKNFDRDLLVSYYKRNFALSAFNRIDKLEQGMGIQLYDMFNGLGSYSLNNQPKTHIIFYDTSINCVSDGFDNQTGSFEITRFDTINFIISGRFNFTVAEPGCDTVHVTDGRFDIKYAY